MTNTEALVAKAKSQVAMYPQYNGYFDNVVFGTMKRKLSVKTGLVATKGETVIVFPESKETIEFGPMAGKEFITVWSIHYGGAVSIQTSDIEF